MVAKPPHLTVDFNDTGGALVLDAVMKTDQFGMGRVLKLENNRIEPTDEDRAKIYGMLPEHYAHYSVIGNARQEEFSTDQLRRFQDALARTISTYQGYLDRQREHGFIEVSDIAEESIESELVILRDKTWHKSVEEMIKNGSSAEVAIDTALQEQVDFVQGMAMFEKMVGQFETMRATIQHHLHPTKQLATPDQIRKGTAVVTDDLMLGAISYFRDPETGELLVPGVAVGTGSMEGHAPIIVKGMGPAYARTDIDRLKDGDIIIFDGERSRIIVNPPERLVKAYESLIAEQDRFTEALNRKWANQSTIKIENPKDPEDTKINIHCNLGMSYEAKAIREANPVGIGLYRTEMAFKMRGEDVPKIMDDAVWLPIFEQNMRACAPEGRESNYIGTTFRTIDLAGDKSDKANKERKKTVNTQTPYQMKALVRLRAKLKETGDENKVRVMVPIISSADDMQEMQEMMDAAAAEVGGESIKLGCMVEVISLIDELEHVDASFFSVGTNDLVHSICRVDRYSQESIEKYDPTNPSVIKNLRKVIEAGKKKNIPVSVCGDMASDPKHAAILVGLGYRNFSTDAASTNLMKEELSKLSNKIDLCEKLVEDLEAIHSRAERDRVLDAFYEEHIQITPEEKQTLLNEHYYPFHEDERPAPDVR